MRSGPVTSPGHVLLRMILRPLKRSRTDNPPSELEIDFDEVPAAA